MDYQRVIDWADTWIVDRSGRVVFAFILVTGVFALGLGNVSTETGTEQFAEEVPAEDALNAVNREFSPPFAVDSGSTQLIQRGENVLSREGLTRMLRAQYRLEQRPSLRVTETSSAARIVATQLDPSATTLESQLRVVERATEGEIDAAVQEAAEENPQFATLLSTDFNPREASASATIGVVEHEIPAGLEAGAGTGGTSPLTPIQQEASRVVDTVGGDILVFGEGTIAAEFGTVIFDSLILVVPAAVVLIVFFLVIAYRDLIDLLLGIAGLVIALVWTFGFMGLAGIAFNQILIAVPPLLLAVGIDYGIHAINRYREERASGLEVSPAMRIATDQLLVAFFIVTATTVIGFASNLTSQLVPIQDFGLVAAVGITFTFLIFGVFVPAAKAWLDRLRTRYPLPTFSQKPIGSAGSLLGRILMAGVAIARRGPLVFLIVVLAVSAGAGVYATGIDTTFSDENFLPPEETPDYLKELPEPFAPGEYTVTATINFLEDNFEAAQDDSVTIYLQAPMERDSALESIQRADRNPPDSFVQEDRMARSDSILTIIDALAAQDPQFRQLVDRHDTDGDGIPDRDLETVYDALLTSPLRDETLTYITEDRRSARIVYSIKGDASQEAITEDARQVADRYRYDATATGQTVVFQAISDLILASAITSLSIALAGTAILLFIAYWVFEGRPSLGIANLVPIVVTVAFVAGSMRFFGISFNAFTATVLAITIGLGIDYSVHVVHRFTDELAAGAAVMPALEQTIIGTGGALTGSMFTTVFGIGVLVLSVFPAIGQFGLLTALSVIYAYLTSILVLPATLVVWSWWAGRGSSPLVAEHAETAD